MSIPRQKLDVACTRLHVDCFDDDEYTFLKQYHKVMSLVARALKVVESNKSTFGIYLPTLFGLRHNLNAIKGIADMCSPLILQLESAFESRFGNIMDKYDDHAECVPLYLAMLTDPRFKMNCMGFASIPTHVRRFVKTIMLNACLVNSDGDDNAEDEVPLNTPENNGKHI